MMQISKTLREIEYSRNKAKEMAMKGKYPESDDYIMDAYANAIYLFENYGAEYFSDTEYEFLKTVIDEVEQ